MKSLYKGLILLFLINIYTPSFAQKSTSITFDVAGNCGMCKQRIEKAAKIDGVSEAVWDSKTGKATVKYNAKTTSPTAIKQAIAAVGHDTDEVRAKDEVYATLHQCCLYERLDAAKGDDDHAEDGHDHDHDHTVRGVVVRENEKGDLTPIPGVNVYWLENPKTQLQSNENGVFDIAHEKGYTKLVVSFVGMKADTITVRNLHEVLIIHAKNNVVLRMMRLWRQAYYLHA